MQKIVIKGAREHNLKNIDVEIPRDKLVVITGLSGSGKSSLAFDTIYAEGQRRYVESLSAYARQFLDQMHKPDVDSIEGLSPAISIEQKTGSRNPRSTVGTATEIYDYLRLLWARVGAVHCWNCGQRIESQSIQQMVDQVMEFAEGERFSVLAPVVRDKKGDFADAAGQAAPGWLRARQHRRRPARAGRAAHALENGRPHHRGVRRPAGQEGRHPPAAGRFDRAGGQAGRGRGEDLAAGRRRPAVQREVRLPDLRDQLPGDHAAPVLVQQPGRRLSRRATASARRCSSTRT